MSNNIEKKDYSIPEAPAENFAKGIWQVEIPELGVPIKGKVRDIWVVDNNRVMVTTDRLSAYDRLICTIPGKGQVLNLLSAFWFEKTKDIIPNHMIAIPHPNVLIAKQAQKGLPVEIILRRYMARSSTSTSVYHNYVEQGRREIYGVKFPEGLKANQEFPMGTILTPTTKAEGGKHDQELTDEQAKEIVDGQLGDGIWAETKSAAFALFERAQVYHKSRGLILADTKYEFGLDKDENLMVIDELYTPDSSRFWWEKTYKEKFEAGADPDSFDKEILRRWLAQRGFRGEGIVPVVDKDVIEQMAAAYKVPYEMITGQNLPEQKSDSEEIKKIILEFTKTQNLIPS